MRLFGARLVRHACRCPRSLCAARSRRATPSVPHPCTAQALHLHELDKPLHAVWEAYCDRSMLGSGGAVMMSLGSFLRLLFECNLLDNITTPTTVERLCAGKAGAPVSAGFCRAVPLRRSSPLLRAARPAQSCVCLVHVAAAAAAQPTHLSYAQFRDCLARVVAQRVAVRAAQRVPAWQHPPPSDVHDPAFLAPLLDLTLPATFPEPPPRAPLSRRASMLQARQSNAPRGAHQQQQQPARVSIGGQQHHVLSTTSVALPSAFHADNLSAADLRASLVGVSATSLDRAVPARRSTSGVAHSRSSGGQAPAGEGSGGVLQPAASVASQSRVHYSDETSGRNLAEKVRGWGTGAW